MSVLDKLKKNSTIKETIILSKSKFLNEKDMIPTPIPMLNVALSGSLDGGFTPGVTVWAGPSRHFKTAFCLLTAKVYMDRYPEAVLMFYDNEFGSPKKYFEAFGIDMDRVLHIPFTNIEELKFDVMNQLTKLERGDRVFFMVDSIGNVASKKEIDDAVDQKSSQDMTRSKMLKSLFRMITPHLTMKDIPMSLVAHTYKTMEMFSKDVVSGGTGPMYAGDSVFIIGRQQEKDGQELLGYNFIINVEKSRFVKEKSKIPISVSHEHGIGKYSGLIELGIESGFVDNSSKGWYSKIDKETGEILPKVRLADTFTAKFWDDILSNPEFKEFVKKKYQVAYKSIMEGENEAEKDVDEGV